MLAEIHQLIKDIQDLLDAFKRIAIIVAACAIFMCFYHLFGILFPSDEPLVRKPIEAWSPADVSVWVSGLGPWSKEINESRFLEMGVNGKILKSLTEKDLEDPLGIEKPYHRHALLSEIDHVKMFGVKQPTDLWEYKAAFQARCMFLLCGVCVSPRATAVYTFIAFHDEVFIALLYYTSEYLQDSNASKDIIVGERPPVIEYLRFSFQVLFTPYYLIGKFALHWFDVNPWIVSVILIFCTLETVDELFQSCWLLIGGWKKLTKTIWKDTKNALLHGAIHLVIWHFIPSLFCDIAFYSILFYSLLDAWYSVKNIFTLQRDENVPQFRVYQIWETIMPVT